MSSEIGCESVMLASGGTNHEARFNAAVDSAHTHRARPGSDNGYVLRGRREDGVHVRIHDVHAKDLALVHRIRSGDFDALKCLGLLIDAIRMKRCDVRTLSKGMCDLADAKQAVFAAISHDPGHRLAGYQGHSALKVYLYQAVRNRLKDEGRKGAASSKHSKGVQAMYERRQREHGGLHAVPSLWVGLAVSRLADHAGEGGRPRGLQALMRDGLLDSLERMVSLAAAALGGQADERSPLLEWLRAPGQPAPDPRIAAEELLEWALDAFGRLGDVLRQGQCPRKWVMQADSIRGRAQRALRHHA